MESGRKPRTGARWPGGRPALIDIGPLALLVALVAAFLFRYLFLGRSLFSLDLIPVFQPWLRHFTGFWPSPATSGTHCSTRSSSFFRAPSI